MIRPRSAVLIAAFSLTTIGVLFAQKAWREYPALEYGNFPIPPDFQEKTEWVFGRLIWRLSPHYLTPYYLRQGYGQVRDMYWTMDYPRSDRHFSQGLRRLTRVHARSVEQPISLDDPDDVYNWPWLYGVEVGHWGLTDEQAQKMREYLLRGGFFMCDDFHGTQEWAVFAESMKKVFPNRPIVDIDSKDPIFHVIYDLDDRFQVPGAQWFDSHRTFENDGYEPKWRGIYDDKGRLMVAICHNMDLGDAWEWSDDPRYPEKWASLAYRIGVNYVVYAMTH